ncbi:peptidase P60 [Mesorhizobium sp. NBSH29]|uniref:C40 family peptidase n=1 Tax=Mesorhizobium sp. NBSH29 TaxID=2654249 RepID=UPI0018964EB0|nr:NlpC/P60 family protein [Mesorhizobium sp. NBSH29]QPC86560.1 peptidase P60 [Mesorhizobium sp. NBSH29]
MTLHDKRLHAFRDDLADERLRGSVAASKFVAGRPARIGTAVADLRRAPRPDAGLDTQLLCGEDVIIFEETEGWAWVQAVRDGYVGYVADKALGASTGATSHIVHVPRTFIYPGPDMKLPRTGHLSIGSRVAIAGEAETRGTRFGLLPSGEAVVLSHLRSVGEQNSDFVSVAETLLNTPYLWGGVTGFGIDCSGLVQLSMHMAGHAVLRDTDMQSTTIGTPIDPGTNYEHLKRGDLVFWQGHVAILTDAENILHASGHSMQVSREPLRDAVERISYLYKLPTGFRRL